MTFIELLACVGMITGFFLLLNLKPIDFTNGLFGFLTRESKSIRDKWSPGNEGVRVTVVRASDHAVVTTPIDLTNKSPSDIRLHFGKVSKLSYTGGCGVSPSGSKYSYVNPAQALPTIISSGSGNANIEAIKSYFTSVSNVYYPSGDSQIVWVRWTTPSTPQTMTIQVSVSGGGSTSQGVITAKIVDLDQNEPPNPVADDRNDSYTKSSVPSNAQVISSSWGYGVLGGKLIGYGTALEMTRVIGVIMAGGSLFLTAIMPAFLLL